ncbi:ABC transporter substrate-binding protein [Antarcticirhabdus aurantiaca]|uniref:ABC transporter substrate-binding protein n=1 Tax=Antarcticirhabdus aurantiaca TaxID=2606717 RepID=A0ACD4NSG5_9HYPH|nr:ABC transporter substrate-binding protein [Antarcticirhabdus aurantiaca]WAJ29719.1 ABC transporter substrate-binding protein [Jeongeuplla avenae]
MSTLARRTGTASRLALGTALAALALFGAAPAVLAETPADTLVIANGIDDLISLDPAQAFEFSGLDQINNIYETLVEIDPTTLQPVPGLAESWTVSEDGQTFTFKIRQGRAFASGNPVTAKDAAFSIQRVVRLNQSPAFILTQFGLTPENIEQTVTAPDDQTLVIKLDRPYAPTFVTNALTAEVGSVVDMQTVMEHVEGEDLGNAWLSVNSAGSGPYMLRAWKPNESVILEANPNFDRPVPLKRVFVRHVVEPATQRLLLENGDVDIARNIAPTDIDAIEAAEGTRMQTELRGQIYYLSGNQKNEILAKPQVMEAIKYLIDYEGMANSIVKGTNQVHQSFLPQGFLGAIDDKPYAQNVEKAKQLLTEAGYPDGFPIEILIRNEQERIDIAQALQGSLAQGGIKASIRQTTGAEALSIFRARNHQLTLQTWGPDYPDPNTNASVFAANADNTDEGQLTGNLAWRNAYAATETTPMVAEAVVEKDENKRRALYEEMQRISQKSSPFAIMFQRSEPTGVRDGVEGFKAGGAVSSAFYWTVSKGGAAQ